MGIVAMTKGKSFSAALKDGARPLLRPLMARHMHPGWAGPEQRQRNPQVEGMHPQPWQSVYREERINTTLRKYFHFIWLKANWGCKQAGGREEYGLSSSLKWQEPIFLWLLCFNQIATSLMSGLCCCCSESNAFCFGLWLEWATMMGWGMPCNSNLLHTVKNFSLDCQWTEKKIKEKICAETSYKFHFAWVQRVRLGLKSLLKTISSQFALEIARVH